MAKARFAVFSTFILILFLPFAVNASFTDEVKLVDSGYTGAISIDGDTAIIGVTSGVGAGTNTGYADVYTRDAGTGAWTLQQKLFAAAGASGDSFGYSVSVSGDRAVIGAIGQGAYGATYVFERDSGTGVWTEAQTLPPSDNPIAYFGEAVSVSGDWAVVGTQYATGGGSGTVTYAGAAYMFKRNSGTGVWEFTQKLYDSAANTGDGGKYAYFGTAVDIDGTFLIIGARDSDLTYAAQGLVHIYEFGTTWELKGYAQGTAASNRFGSAVAISGDTALMAASGTSYVVAYVRDSVTGSWNLRKVFAPPLAGVNFSRAISISGDIALFGTSGDDELDTNAGATWVSERDPGTVVWTDTKLLATDGIAYDAFGGAVAISGDLAMIRGDGVVYFYKNSSGVVDETPPTVTSVTPVDGATNVGSTTLVTATFIEDMDATTINDTNFTLANSGAVAGAVTYDAGSRTATFTPTNDLAYSTTYTATVTTGAADSAGNNMASDYTWTFTTGAELDTTPPTVTAVTPLDGATGVATNAIVTISFSERIHAANIHSSFTLSSVGGAVAGTVTTAIDQLSATFTPTNDLAYSTIYTAIVTTGTTDLAGNPLGSAKEWDFTTGVSPDTTPPTITAVAPTDAATDVALSATITATFSEAMDASTINATNFTLAGGGAVAGAVSYDAGSMTATFVPSADLTEATTYTATFSTGATDAAGNGLGSANMWSFTTVTVTIDGDGDGVIDSEDDYPSDQARATPVTTTGTGKILVDTTANSGTVLTNCRGISVLDPGLNQTGKPVSYKFTDGLVGCDVENVTPGGTVVLTLTFPTTYPAGTLYYKVDSAGFYKFSGAVINGNAVALTLTDDGLDGDETTNDGVIQGTGGVASPSIDSSDRWWEGGCFLRCLE